MTAGVWTAAIASFLGMSEAASSREVFTAVYSDGEMYERAARHGICLVGYDMFNWVRGDPLNSLSSWSGIVGAWPCVSQCLALLMQLNVRNLYGSQFFGDGYVSWTDERRKHLPALPPDPPDPPSPPPMPPSPPSPPPLPPQPPKQAVLPVDPVAVLEAAKAAGGAAALAAARGASRAASRRAKRNDTASGMASS